MWRTLDHKFKNKMLLFESGYDPIYKSYWTSWITTKSALRYSCLACYLKQWDGALDLGTYQELIN